MSCPSHVLARAPHPMGHLCSPATRPAPFLRNWTAVGVQPKSASSGFYPLVPGQPLTTKDTSIPLLM